MQRFCFNQTKANHVIHVIFFKCNIQKYIFFVVIVQMPLNETALRFMCVHVHRLICTKDARVRSPILIVDTLKIYGSLSILFTMQNIHFMDSFVSVWIKTDYMPSTLSACLPSKYALPPSLAQCLHANNNVSAQQCCTVIILFWWRRGMQTHVYKI